MVSNYSVICDTDIEGNILGYSLEKDGVEIQYHYNRQMAIDSAKLMMEKEQA